MRNFKGIYVGRKMDKVAYNSQNLLLKFLRYNKKSKKLNIICPGIHVDVDDRGYIRRHDKRFFYEVDDYNLPYGDIMEMYLPFSNRKLDEIGKELANIINRDRTFDKYNSIVLIGIGEGGLCFVNMAKYLQREVRIATIATPFDGTGVVDKKYLDKKLDNKIKKTIYSYLEERYNFKNEEIAWNSNFLKGINYKAMTKHRWINFVVTSAKSKLRVENLIERFFGLSIYHCKNDGITPLISQKIENSQICNDIYISATVYDALLVALEYFSS